MLARVDSVYLIIMCAYLYLHMHTHSPMLLNCKLAPLEEMKASSTYTTLLASQCNCVAYTVVVLSCLQSCFDTVPIYISATGT